MYKVILWGIGDGYNVFTQLHGHNQVHVVAITDRNKKHIKSIDGIPLITPEEIKNYEFDYLVVSVINDKFYKEIIQDAERIGIKRDIILPLRIFQIPFFEFKKYIEIKNSNISIVSDYCYGGLLYHKFGLKHLSPTINMFADNDNYFRFICNLKKYMSIPMEEIEDIMENSYKEFYTVPRGKIDDVEWIFNHDLTYQSAAERWNKGVERFNWDNYIILMTIRSDEMAFKFDQLPIKHKIGFYWKDLGLNSIVCMPEWNDSTYWINFRHNFSILANRAVDEKYGIRAVNWMKALLHEDDFIRVR